MSGRRTCGRSNSAGDRLPVGRSLTGRPDGSGLALRPCRWRCVGAARPLPLLSLALDPWRIRRVSALQPWAASVVRHRRSRVVADLVRHRACRPWRADRERPADVGTDLWLPVGSRFADLGRQRQRRIGHARRGWLEVLGVRDLRARLGLAQVEAALKRLWPCCCIGLDERRIRLCRDLIVRASGDSDLVVPAGPARRRRRRGGCPGAAPSRPRVVGRAVRARLDDGELGLPTAAPARPWRQHPRRVCRALARRGHALGARRLSGARTRRGRTRSAIAVCRSTQRQGQGIVPLPASPAQPRRLLPYAGALPRGARVALHRRRRTLVHHPDVERRLRRAALGRAQQPAGAGLLVLRHADALTPAGAPVPPWRRCRWRWRGAQLVDRHRRPVGGLAMAWRMPAGSGRCGRGRCWSGAGRQAAQVCRGVWRTAWRRGGDGGSTAARCARAVCDSRRRCPGGCVSCEAHRRYAAAERRESRPRQDDGPLRQEAPAGLPVIPGQ